MTDPRTEILIKLRIERLDPVRSRVASQWQWVIHLPDYDETANYTCHTRQTAVRLGLHRLRELLLPNEET